MKQPGPGRKPGPFDDPLELRSQVAVSPAGLALGTGPHSLIDHVNGVLGAKIWQN